MGAHQQQANTVIASSVHDEIHTPPLPISNPTAAAAVDYLKPVNASVFYKDTILSSVAIRPIFANVDHLVEANIGVSSGYLNTSIGDSMVSDWSLGAINFNIKVNALVLQIIEDETKTIKRLRTSFSCENVTIGFADGKNWAGTMIGGSRDCIKYP
ncbi:hypothetical protein Patl1_20807 [Pistacia atlantica]|uniref:Uncharacterized protein n=1 Tax=Pistacia atlantica TaxID=434234 RepID=A0ACC1BMC0_9ROSI|nr:hypothetical protein Patl1_20807 [Pistacia atlantica]